MAGIALNKFKRITLLSALIFGLLARPEARAQTCPGAVSPSRAQTLGLPDELAPALDVLLGAGGLQAGVRSAIGALAEMKASGAEKAAVWRKLVALIPFFKMRESVAFSPGSTEPVYLFKNPGGGKVVAFEPDGTVRRGTAVRFAAYPNGTEICDPTQLAIVGSDGRGPDFRSGATP